MVWRYGSPGDYTVTVSVPQQSGQKEITCDMMNGFCMVQFFGLELSGENASVSIRKSKDKNSVVITDVSGIIIQKLLTQNIFKFNNEFVNSFRRSKISYAKCSRGNNVILNIIHMCIKVSDLIIISNCFTQLITVICIVFGNL